MNEIPPPQTSRAPRRRSTIALAFVAAAGVALVAGIYGYLSPGRNSADTACASTAALARRIAPLAKGEVAAVVVADAPRQLPALSFSDASGETKTLADWRGRTVLLNLWATWCVPCRKEMPALDALQRELGSERFEVVAVNIDTRDPTKPKAWLAETGVKALAYYADPSARIFQELKAIGKAFGMPTTLLVDTNGCEIASLAGPAEWASPDALALVKAALAGSPAQEDGPRS
ncbi:MAG: TlpA disulfide reductase family protein [Xanthobacteraceae bacterium]